MAESLAGALWRSAIGKMVLTGAPWRSAIRKLLLAGAPWRLRFCWQDAAGKEDARLH